MTMEDYNIAICEFCNLDFEQNSMEYESELDTGHFWFRCSNCSGLEALE